jgi:hypothetical protein
VHRTNVRDHTYVRSREDAQLGDLPEAAHRQLENAELGVGLDAADGQRHADLRVVAPLCGNGAALRHADRGQDVLRRRLPHRAGDPDESRNAPRAHTAGERGERGESVGRDEGRRRSPCEGVLDEVRPAPDRDEQVAFLDTARVGLEAGDFGRPGGSLEATEAELADLLQRERDHAVVFSARSASPATSASSNGTTVPPAS